MGQHFIVNRETIEKIVNAAELKPKDKVLEIGAGTGFLTRELLKECKVTAIEMDEILCELLEKELEQKNLELICGDYLRVKVPDYNKIVSFPPYFLSKKIIQKILKEQPLLCTLVFQREFAEKLAALPGFLSYSALSVLCQYYYRIELMESIQAKNFFPKPKSDSKIVKMKKLKKRRAVNEKGFGCFIKQVFRHKNKNLSNAISDSQNFLKKANLKKNYLNKSKQLRLSDEKVMRLPVEELVSIYNSLCKKN